MLSYGLAYGLEETLEHADFTDFLHLRVTDHGCVKGASPVTDETIARIAAQGKTLLAAAP